MRVHLIVEEWRPSGDGCGSFQTWSRWPHARADSVALSSQGSASSRKQCWIHSPPRDFTNAASLKSYPWPARGLPRVKCLVCLRLGRWGLASGR